MLLLWLPMNIVDETLLCVNGGIYVITVTANEYRVDETLSFVNGEIYVITGKCLGQNYPLWWKREWTFS